MLHDGVMHKYINKSFDMVCKIEILKLSFILFMFELRKVYICMPKFCWKLIIVSSTSVGPYNTVHEIYTFVYSLQTLVDDQSEY